MCTVTTRNRTATVNVARLEHLVRSLLGALWRTESHVAAMEHACGNESYMPSLKRVLKEDVLEVSFVAVEAADEICEIIGVPTMEDANCPDPRDNYAEYRKEYRRRLCAEERHVGGAA